MRVYTTAAQIGIIYLCLDKLLGNYLIFNILFHMSKPALYFENNLASISSHPAGYVQLTYHAGKCVVEDLEAALQHTGDLLQRHRWTRLLEDQQQLVPLTAEQQQVMSGYWQRQTHVLGHSLCVATVLAQNVFSRLATATLRHKLQTADINYRLFDDASTANSWLQRQSKYPRLS
jgi:hypothetical protein